MFKKIFLIIIIILIFIAFKSDIQCRDLTNNLKVNYQEVIIALEGDIHNDVNIPLWQVRLFHNKPVYLGRELIKKILILGDIKTIVGLTNCFSAK